MTIPIPPLAPPDNCGPELPAYYARIKNELGTVVAVFDTWRSLQYQRKVNDAGFAMLIIDGNDTRKDLLREDYLIEIWRRVGLHPWRLDFEAIINDHILDVFENGNAQFTIVGTGLIGLLARRIIAYRSNTAQANKTGQGEIVVKQFVNENIGPGAVFPPRLFASGVMAGFAVEADTGFGVQWQGQRAGKNLLEVAREIATFCGFDFDVVRTGAASYEFRTYIDQLGEDRTNTGIDPATGKNFVGNAPLIFSIPLGNIARSSYTIKRGGSANAVYVWGQGQGIARSVAYAENAGDLALSSIARRELSRDGKSQADVADLQQLANEHIAELAPSETFEFTPRMTQYIYGRDFDLGDRVTGLSGSTSFNKRITAITITVSDKGESPPKLEMADIA